MSDLTIALITIFGTVASVSGIVAYVFNGTRKLIKEMHTATMEMQREGERRHREAMETLGLSEQRQREVMKTLMETIRLSEMRHEEVMETLKKDSAS